MLIPVRNTTFRYIMTTGGVFFAKTNSIPANTNPAIAKGTTDLISVNAALTITLNTMLIKSAKSKVPLVFNLYFVDSQMVELELFQADSSSIDDNSFWDNNQNLLYDVTWEFLE